MALQYASPLLILGYTVERFISIKRPFKSERFARKQRYHNIGIFALSLIALALGIPQYFGWEVDEDDDTCNGSNSNFYTVWSWISDILVFVVFPVTTLILNILVMRATAVAENFRRESDPAYQAASRRVSSVADPRQKRKHVSPSTATLLTVSFYRLATLIPVGIIFILQFSYPIGDENISVEDMGTDSGWRKHFSWFIAKKIIDEIGLSQYSCNFFIYLATSEMFRNDLKQCVGISRQTKSRNMSLDVIR